MLQRYPLMPLNKEGRPFHDKAGNVIVVEDAEMEEAFYKDHPGAVPVPPTVEPVPVEQELEKLRAEHEALQQQLATFQAECNQLRAQQSSLQEENAALHRALADVTVEHPTK